MHLFTQINIPYFYSCFPHRAGTDGNIFLNHLLKGGFYLNLLYICLLFNKMSWLLQ